MRPALLLAIAACAPGCQLIFKLEDVQDKVPHIPATENEEPGDQDLIITKDFETYDTSGDVTQLFPGQATFEKLKQDRADVDVVIMRVGHLTVATGANFLVHGTTPILILARTVQIDGTIDVSARGDGLAPGAGGGRPGMGDPGEGGVGVVGNGNNNTGGGGGGFGGDGGSGGDASCPIGDVPGGAPGKAHGDPTLIELRGGGAGGSGGARCALPFPNIRGGHGGGAIQISATESIAISATGAIRASGGGGGFGAGGCAMKDDAGSGGGAGGAIYLDAPEIGNDGVIEAFGGGGGGGGDDQLMGTGNGQNGNPGHFGNEGFVPPPGMSMPSVGGAGQPEKGKTGGTGARTGKPTSGEDGTCIGPLTVNTGGGGGGIGRIVVRVVGDVSPFGSITPEPVRIEYPSAF